MSSCSVPLTVIHHYFPDTRNVQISSLGKGNINDTFLVSTQGRIKRIVLQRINEQVFTTPEALIHNLQILHQHISSHLVARQQRWQDIHLIPTPAGEYAVFDEDHRLWRALTYVSHTISVTKTENLLQAEQAGWALGFFHRKLVGLDTKILHPPLPGFHQLSSYLKTYDNLNTTKTNSAALQSCKKRIDENRMDALSLELAANSGKIQQRIIHGDPKIGNFLFDQRSGKAVSIIDLDTVGPGLLQHDIGDCLRSICNIGGETGTPAETEFDLPLCQAMLEGYFKETEQLLTPLDREYFFAGLYAMTFELGLRFFTDYLQGNIYFKCQRPEETLQKALVQFALLQDIYNKKPAIQRFIQL